MAGIPTFTTTCLNCGAPLNGQFCASCGQNHRHERLSVTDWLGDVVGGITNLESRILHTIFDLTRRPGAMVRDYVEGRRARYISPARYALATCALWWLAVSLNPESSALWWVEYGQLINLASLPVIALFVQLPFAGSGRNYAESLAFMFFVSGHAFLWRVLLALSAFVDAPALVVSIFDQVLFLAYFVWALWGFYRGRVRLLALRIVGGVLGLLIVGGALNLALMLWAPR